MQSVSGWIEFWDILLGFLILCYFFLILNILVEDRWRKLTYHIYEGGDFVFLWLTSKFTNIYLEQLLRAPYQNSTYTVFNKLNCIKHFSYTRPSLSVSPKQVCHKNI